MPVQDHASAAFNEHVLRAEIVSRWGEHGAHADVYDHMARLATERMHIEAICLAGCQDCVTVQRTHDPEVGWVWVVDDCCIDPAGPAMQAEDIEVLRNSFIAVRKALSS